MKEFMIEFLNVLCIYWVYFFIVLCGIIIIILILGYWRRGLTNEVQRQIIRTSEISNEKLVEKLNEKTKKLMNKEYDFKIMAEQYETNKRFLESKESSFKIYKTITSLNEFNIAILKNTQKELQSELSEKTRLFSLKIKALEEQIRYWRNKWDKQ